MDHTDTSALTILADAAIAGAEAEMAMAFHKSAAPSREDDDAEVAEAAAILTSMRKVEINKTPANALPGSTPASSGFATVAGGENGESCWSKAARKNRDKEYKTWQTFNILRPRQDAAARISKPEITKEQTKKPTKKQAEKMERWMKGYHHANDKYGFIQGLGPVGETDTEVLGVNFNGTMAMEAEVEKAGGLLEWKKWKQGKQWEGEWRENYDDENPFLTK